MSRSRVKVRRVSPVIARCISVSLRFLSSSSFFSASRRCRFEFGSTGLPRGCGGRGTASAADGFAASVFGCATRRTAAGRAGFAASACRRFSCLSRLRRSATSRNRSFSFAELRSARKISNVSLRGSSPNCSGRVNTQSMYSCSRCSCAADGLSQRCSFRLTSSLRKRSRSRSARPAVATMKLCATNSRSVARWPAWE